MYKVGNQKFKSKAAVQETVRDLLKRFDRGSQVVGDDLYFLIDLLGHHPQVTRKLEGFRGILVGQNGFGKKCFQIRRVFGPRLYLSVNKCVRGLKKCTAK